MIWLGFVALFGVTGAISLSYARPGISAVDRISFVIVAIACVYLAAHSLVAFALTH